MLSIWKEIEEIEEKRKVSSVPILKWPRILSYAFDQEAAADGKTVELIRRAANFYSLQTCVTFHETYDATNYVLIDKEGG